MGDMIDWLNVAGTREERLKENGRRREREKTSFSNGFLGERERKKDTRGKEMSTVSLSLSLKDVIQSIETRSDMLIRFEEQPLSHPLLRPRTSFHHLAPQLWRNCPTYRWYRRIKKKRKRKRGETMKRRGTKRQDGKVSSRDELLFVANNESCAATLPPPRCCQ